MVCHRWKLIFALQTFLVFGAAGYKIDQSCAQEGIENDVRNAMTSAFEMVDSALARLTASPLQQTTVDVLGKLFAGPGQDPRTAVTARTVDVFAQIRDNYRNEVPVDQPVGEDDLIIFCNRDHYQLIDKNKDIWLDKANDVFFHSKEAMCGNSMKDKLFLAETSNPLRETDRKYKLGKDAISTLIGKTVVNLSGKAPFGFVQIDAFALLDKVLLHEMTHGRSAYVTRDENGEVEDEGLIGAKTSRGWLGLGLLKATTYGWSKCASLAKRDDRLGGINAADNNADTLALFGSICKVMDDRNSPRTVDDKGRIIPLA
ncbi:hypothetical protein EK21DRAFT_118997 [Setomelanomma holmii]|uniref:Lysine-specific metallo-endopeptidase domain-containing protein n=1 Tax=Setomelanomma holmii TaxID=210430 RepID=A0A9P4GUL3_9PLEO|nr:hypothetical protein EK21DRAFT_118997 [Setomelanomma holmii]